MRRVALGFVIVTIGWIAAAPPAAASCPSGPSVESFARGHSSLHDQYLVIGDVTHVRPWPGPHEPLPPLWEAQVEVTAVIGVERTPTSIEVASYSERFGTIGGPMALAVHEQGGIAWGGGCRLTVQVDDPESLADRLELIATHYGTPFARPGPHPQSWWAQTALVVGTITAVGLLDAGRRRMVDSRLQIARVRCV